MGLGRVLTGTLCCVAIAMLIVFFATLGYGQVIFGTFGFEPIPEGIFFLLMNPYSLSPYGGWVVFPALAAGAFIGGLISKSSIGGVIIGELSYGLIVLMYYTFVIVFDITEMSEFLLYFDFDVIIDIVASYGLLIALGAIGGTLTKE